MIKRATFLKYTISQDNSLRINFELFQSFDLSVNLSAINSSHRNNHSYLMKDIIIFSLIFIWLLIEVFLNCTIYFIVKGLLILGTESTD